MGDALNFALALIRDHAPLETYDRVGRTLFRLLVPDGVLCDAIGCFGPNLF